jgi:hypothetical protein
MVFLQACLELNCSAVARFCRAHIARISPEPGILGRLSVGSSGGSRKPAQEQSNSDRRTRKIGGKNAVATLMRTIRCGSCNAVNPWIEPPMAMSAGAASPPLEGERI